jgi:hypothetical protein
MLLLRKGGQAKCISGFKRIRRTTSIEYQIPQEGLVTLRIFDVAGREVATLVNQHNKPGKYNVEFDATNLSSGMYIYQLKANDFISTKKMMLLK